MTCVICGRVIPVARLEALPNATTCVSCSTTPRYKGFTVVAHKTGNYTQVVKDPAVFAELKRLDHSKGRARTGYAGAK